MRDLAALPKAHLHLHFTGSMRLETLVELATATRTRLPASLLDGDPLRVPADRRGWFRFQRAYDTARALVRSEEIMRRLVLEAAMDDAAEGSRRLEMQVDPTSYAPFVGGITPALEIILDAARQATALTGVEVAIIVAASRMRHPLDGRTLARLAVRYAGQDPGSVVGFGLSNDERAGQTASWGPAFAIARRGGLACVPHGGELLGPEHVREVVRALGPTRLGHGVRTGEDPALLAEVVDQGISLEVCPASNVGLGVYPCAQQVPLPALLAHGAQVALGADDPLLFQSRLVDQYEIARSLGCDDAALAELARGSIRASLASADSKRQWLAQVEDWLAGPDPDSQRSGPKAPTGGPGDGGPGGGLHGDGPGDSRGNDGQWGSAAPEARSR
ncbi:adenosine deaminase [Actinomyces bowdenii]|uniref:adenosine deaminase n=1 Tax=Actinomyces bowdenii TaxID=131109 RepID=UPI00214AFBF8|nr:adenosine deaminase [Actinomyces bowdenii]MCR2052438.1 adenosine deaminase [Actinomyces bowdenii]